MACIFDRQNGWRAQLSALSRWAIVAFGSARARAGEASTALHPLAQRNHVVLTSDGSGSGTKISLRVNGTLVAREVDAGGVARFDSFGIWAAGERGEAVLVSRIDATTR